MLGTGLSAWPQYTEEEIEAVSRVLRSNKVNYWTGQICRKFERDFASWSGASHAIGLANGTVALDLALAGLRIGSCNGGSQEDEVIVTPRTFLASVSSIVNAGARPVFADIDLDSGNICVGTIEPRLTSQTKAIVPVHLAGWPCDMDPIIDLASAANVSVIEDCAQAHGARYKGRPVGSIGDVGAWSFCQDKIMTTGGEGGMVTCNDDDLWSAMWSYKDHGKSWEAVYERKHPAGFRWLHESFGTNWRMMEVQAAIGEIQLTRMKQWTRRRTQISEQLFGAFSPYSGIEGSIRAPRLEKSAYARGSTHGYYKLYVYVREERLAKGWTRDRIAKEISALGIPAFQGSCSEVYREKAFQGTGFAPACALPNAQLLGQTSIMMLVHPTLTDEEVDRSCKAVDTVLARATM